MIEWLDGLLHAQPLLVFALVVAIGYLVGKIRIKGLELGSVSGVLGFIPTSAAGIDPAAA